MSLEQFLAKLARQYPSAVVVDVATVLREGWEMDNYVALVRKDAALHFITTDHGQLTATVAQDLEDAIRRHDEATASCRRVLEMAARLTL